MLDIPPTTFRPRAIERPGMTGSVRLWYRAREALQAEPMRRVLASPLARFTIGSLIAVAVLAAGSAYASRYMGTIEAERDARGRATLLGEVLQPMLASGLDAGFDGVVDEIDAIVHQQLARGPLVRVKVWDESSRVIYSDDRRLMGQLFPLGEDARGALASGRAFAHVSVLAQPENAFEADAERLLEVYVPLTMANGKRVLFESYFSYASVSAESRQIWFLMGPVLLLGMLGLEAVQVPLAWSMARQLEEGTRERGQLMGELEARLERERIARDLHDDTMQSIYGAGLRLHASSSDPQVSKEEFAAQVTQNLNVVVADLRRYMDELTNHGQSKSGARPLVDRLQALLLIGGTRPQWDLDVSGEPIDGPLANQLYLVAKELVSNANRHSAASRATVSLHRRIGFVHLGVRDDGRGFDPHSAKFRGLQGLAGRVEDLGGTFSIRSAVGSGTIVRVTVPVPVLQSTPAS